MLHLSFAAPRSGHLDNCCRAKIWKNFLRVEKKITKACRKSGPHSAFLEIFAHDLVRKQAIRIPPPPSADARCPQAGTGGGRRPSPESAPHHRGSGAIPV